MAGRSSRGMSYYAQLESLEARHTVDQHLSIASNFRGGGPCPLRARACARQFTGGQRREVRISRRHPFKPGDLDADAQLGALGRRSPDDAVAAGRHAHGPWRRRNPPPPRGIS